MESGAGAAAEKALHATTETVSIESLIRDAAKELGQALPAHLNPERLVGIALTSIRLNPELARCTPESFLGSLFVLAQLGLEPVAGQAYLLPYKNRRKVGNNWLTVPEVQAVIGYKGLKDLFYRSEAALSIDAHEVCANDHFEFEYGSTAFLRHRPSLKERGEVIGYYAVAMMKGGGSVFRVMSREEAMEHGQKHSKTFITEEWSEKEHKKVKVEQPYFMQASPWAREPDAMCKKTVMIQLTKFLPSSVELQRAIAVDETSRDFRRGITNVMDLPVTTTWEEEQHPAIEVDAPPKPEAQLPPPQTNGAVEAWADIGDTKKFGDDVQKATALIKVVHDAAKKLGHDRFIKVVGDIGLSNVSEIHKLVDLSTLVNALLKELSMGGAA